MSPKNEREQHDRQEIELKAALGSIRISRDLQESAGPRSLADVKKQVWLDLLSIATAPTGIVATLLQGVIRLIEVITFSTGGSRHNPDSGGPSGKLSDGRRRLSRAEALAEIDRLVASTGGQIIEVEGQPLIVLGDNNPAQLGQPESALRLVESDADTDESA
ncbi:MAG: hypothetical protein AAGC60_00225 [Acidobacteriota bacterium]